MFFLSVFMSDHGFFSLEPVANDVPWYYITVAIIVGAAAVNHGVGMIFRNWEREFKLPNWFSALGDVFGLVFCALLGTVVGYVVWNWALGGAVALVGAFSHAMVMSFVRARLFGYIASKNNEEKTSKKE